MKKNILAIQMTSTIGDIEANYAKVRSMVQEFYSHANPSKLPDFIILPEVWTTGWFCEIFGDIAEKDNRTEAFLSEIAKEFNVNVIGGSHIKEINGTIKNVCPCINRSGDIVARYEKIHLYAPDGEAKAVKSGDVPVIVELDGLKIGLSICYDIRFPELFRSYINSDFVPEFMINMSAWPLTRREQYESMAKARAIENQCYFLALSQTGAITKDVYNAGSSLLVEPMGSVVSKLDDKEGWIFSEIDTSLVESTRNTYPNLANRKVHDFGFVPKFFGGELSCSKK